MFYRRLTPPKEKKKYYSFLFKMLHCSYAPRLDDSLIESITVKTLVHDVVRIILSNSRGLIMARYYVHNRDVKTVFHCRPHTAHSDVKETGPVKLSFLSV